MDHNFEESLISAVFLRTFIYDKNTPNHSKKKLVAQAWREIASETGKSVDVCQKRRKTLKDTFYKHWRKRKGKSGDGLDDVDVVTWKWYEMLTFLRECNIPKRTIDNLEDPTQETDLNSPTSVPSDSQRSDEEAEGSSTISEQAKRTKLWYLEHSNGRKQSSLAEQWGSVIDKCNKLIEASEKGSSVSNSQSQVVTNPFSYFFSCEMEKLTESKQDELKYGTMDLLKTIKSKRNLFND